MKGAPSKELLTYAFIAQGYAGAGSALDGVSYLLANLVGRLDGKVFDPVEIARLAEVELGLGLTPIVIESLVPSLCKIGSLQPVAAADGDAIYRCKAVSGDTKTITEGEIEQVLANFRAFAGEALSEHGLKASTEEIDRALLSFLVTADFLSSWLQSDKSEFKGNVLSLKKESLDSEELKVGKALDTLCALFIQSVHQSDEPLFAQLVAISWGSVVLDVVTTLQVGAVAGGSLDDLTIYVDTPILLDLLDVGDEDQHRYAEDLFDLMTRSGAQVATFSHVIEEMRSAVETTLGRFARGEPFSGPMAKRLRSDPNYALTARLIIAQLEARLEARNISIRPDADYEGADLLPFFPEEQVDSLRSRVGELHRNVVRRDRDAKSLAYVIRSRRGSTVSPVSLSRHVFVTRNVALCKISRSYAEHSGFVPKHSAPPAVTDRQLAGVLWFCAGSPVAVGVGLTHSKIIASCASAVAPRLDVVSRMGQVLFDKDPAKLLEYEALIRDQRAALCITRETLNVVSLVDADQAQLMLDKMKRELSEEAAIQFEIDKAQIVAAYEGSIAELMRERDELSGARRDAEQKDASLQEMQRIVADLREGHGSKIAEVQAEMGGMKEQVAALQGRNEAAALAVHTSLVDQVAGTAKLFTLLMVLLFALLGWIVQRLIGIPYLGVTAGLLYSALGYWVVPDKLLHPLLRSILNGEARKRARRISAASGVEVDEQLVVSEALDRLQAWGHGKRTR